MSQENSRSGSKLIKESAIYTLAGWSTSLLTIILIPIYTRFFTTSDYGLWSIIATTTALMCMILQLGLDSSLTRYFSDSDSEKKKKEYCSTVFWLRLFGAVLVAAILFFFRDDISRLLLGTAEHSTMIMWAVFSIVTTSLWYISLLYYRLGFKPIKYAFWSIAYLVISLSLNIYYVVYTDSGIIGIFYSKVATELALMSAIVIMNIKYFIQPRVRHIRALLKFGLPFVPMTIAFFLLESLDKYFVLHYTGPDALGVYSLAYRISGVLGMFTGGFLIAWAPRLYTMYKKEKKTIELTYKIFIVVSSILCFGIAMFAKEILMLFSTPDFYSGARYIGIITFSVLIFNLGGYFSIGIGIKKKTHYGMYAGIAAAILNFILNYALIPRYGIYGAAIATLISYCCYATIALYHSHKLYPMNYRILPLTIMLGTMIIISSFAHLIVFGIIQSILIKLAFCLAILAIPFISGFVNVKEAVAGIKMLRSIIWFRKKAQIQ